jgi:uncharacterized repeat protein (TIGR01451 family)
MKFSFKFRMFAALAVALMLAGTKAEAQGFGSFGLSVVSSADSMLVSNSLTYTITVTNLVGDLPDVLVSNTLPASVQFANANPGLGVSFTNYGSVMVFDISSFTANTFAQMTLTVQPTATGLITNMVVVSAPVVTNTTATSVVTLVTNLVIQADLGVAIIVPTTAVITNDLMTYGVSVTNAGPDDAPNVVLTNTLPSGVILKGNYTVVSNNLIFNLGTLTSGGSTNLQFTIQPTNAGVLNFFASVGAPGILETNTANNTASNSIVITNYLSGNLVAVTNSAQIVNLVNGLIEQSISLSNIGTNDVAAVRVVVTGLTNRLFNAVGTNSGNPFVVYTAPLAVPLATSQSVNLLLQYAPRLNFPFTNSQLQAFAVPVPNLAPPTVSSSSTNLVISRIIALANGEMLVEFPVLTNRTYTVVYSDNASFSNVMIAPPSIQTLANRVQWIDYGPPTTISLPASVNARFYRVIQNP